MAECKNCIHEKVCVIKAFPDAFENTQWEKYPCEHFKDADVVPKSEYDAVVSAVDNSTKEFLKLHDKYQEQKTECDKWKQLFYDAKKVIGENAQQALEVTNEEVEEAKAEVAREIFEEIEKYKRSPMPECNPVYVINYSIFAELKKKYAEDKT